jgi:hypothetical protein
MPTAFFKTKGCDTTSFDTLILEWQNTRRHNPGDSDLYILRVLVNKMQTGVFAEIKRRTDTNSAVPWSVFFNKYY